MFLQQSSVVKSQKPGQITSRLDKDFFSKVTIILIDIFCASAIMQNVCNNLVILKTSLEILSVGKCLMHL